MLPPATHHVRPSDRSTDHTTQPARLVSTRLDTTRADAAAEALGGVAEALDRVAEALDAAAEALDAAIC
jgi:hypothetical protein